LAILWPRNDLREADVRFPPIADTRFFIEVERDMIAEQAFRAIQAAILAKEDARVIHSRYDPMDFGNFIIAFEDAGRARSVICDRLELVVCNDLQGPRGFRTLFPSVQDVKEVELLRALELE
jgi:hypothetical protein